MDRMMMLYADELQNSDDQQHYVDDQKINEQIGDSPEEFESKSDPNQKRRMSKF